MAVERALISVFDKSGIVELAQRLAALKIEILSTGGTAKLLREAGLAVRDVSDFTGWPEMLGGRVKTLHPKVHGGLLFRRKHSEDQKQAAEHGISPIDLVVVNLYPFEATAAKDGLTAEELIENIDIGGPTMLRSAAKNFESVTVISDPRDYARVAEELEMSRETSLATKLELAGKSLPPLQLTTGESLWNSNGFPPRKASAEPSGTSPWRQNRLYRNACTFRSAASKNCATERIHIKLPLCTSPQAAHRKD